MQNDSKIRVLHIMDKLGVAGSSIHGVSRAITWWIPQFDQSKFQFTVCSLRSPEPAGEVFAQTGISVFYLSKNKFDPSTILSLVSLLKKEQPHIVHLHGYGSTNFGRIASLLTGIPNIVHEHTVIDDQPFYQTVADTILSPLTTKAIAISEPVREFMIQRRKIRAELLDTFFYGLPLSSFTVPKERSVQDTRAELGIHDDDMVVANVGRLDTQKGQIYLLKAASHVIRTVPNARFLIVGDGPDQSMLESVVRKEGIEDRVIFAGYREDIPAILDLSDVVAIPSLWEGGPITVFEAMNLRKPVVGTPVGMMSEVIKDGETGFLVPCKDTTLLAEKLTLLLKDPPFAKSLGEKAWKACQEYDISLSVTRLSQIYEQMVTS
ncbi:MAG: glycosyltransferase [Nitrospirales bacterium]